MSYNMDRWRELLPDGWRPSWLPQMPFTDYHQLNLDWIIETVKEWTERLVAFFDEDGAKDLVEDVLEEHPEWVTTVMDGSITKPKINAAFLKEIENAYVTPEMYGYESGDVSSYLIQALNNSDKFPVILGSRNYTLSETVELPEGAKLYGNTGAAFTWNGTTGGTMFTTQALHNNRPHISGIYFNLGTAETALKVYKAGSWGVSVVVENCRFNGGSGAVIDLRTAYNCIFNYCEFFTQGYIKIAPYNDTSLPENTLSNTNTFYNCYYSGSPTNSTKAFVLKNARSTTFISCTFEKTGLAFEQDADTVYTRTYSCWFESITSLYTGSPVSYTPSSNTYVNVSSFKQNYVDMDEGPNSANTHFAIYTGTETDPYRYLAKSTDKITDHAFTVYNAAARTYDNIYTLNTKEMLTYVPHNIRRVYASATDSISIELDAFFKNGSIAALYKVTGWIYYEDTSDKVSEWSVLQVESNTYKTSQETKLYSTSWGSANTATISRSVASTGVLTITSSIAFRFAHLSVETIPLGNRMKADNT